LYGNRLLVAERAPLPVVSVGNLTVGGTGKTQLVDWLVAHLLAGGVPCAVLSRGYGRRDRRPRYLLPGVTSTGLPPWERIGDEPWMLAARHPGLALGIDPDRHRAARALAPHLDGGVLVLDDGFQHRRLVRDLDIVTVSAADPLGGGRLLPAGRLREPPRALARADLVVVTAGDSAVPGDAAAASDVARQVVARWAPGVPCVVARTRWCGVRPVTAGVPSALRSGGVPGTPSSPPEPPPPSGPVLLVSGIARPGRFEASARAAGLEVCDHRIFGDHHVYTPREAASLGEDAARLAARRVVTTMKDAPRLAAVWSAPVPLAVALVELEPVVGAPGLEEAVASVLATRPPGRTSRA
ncbi:MAG: tetraacyldisaccharide 4'-kinase, partial [Candidatus Eiseniibacteriota bacterium]